MSSPRGSIQDFSGQCRPGAEAPGRAASTRPFIFALIGNIIIDVVTMHLGRSELLLNLDVEFAPELKFERIAAAIERIEGALRTEHPEVRRIFIEARTLT